MTEDLFRFTWPVTVAGYHWITTRTEDQPNPPDALNENATEREKRRHRLMKLESEPRPYLSDGIPSGTETLVQPTFPLKDLRGRLYRCFAETLPTPDGILKFANNFGLLGGDIDSFIPVEDKGGGRSSLGLGEDQRKWIDEISEMAYAVSLWDMVRERQLDRLSELVSWDKDSVGVEFADGRGILIAAKKYKPDRLETIERGDIIQPALLAVQQIVNDRLWNRRRAAPRLLWNRDTKALEQRIVPHGLIGAIWLDFLLAIDGKTEYRRCEWCETAYPVFPKGHRRKFCSNKCRISQHRQRHSQGEKS